MVEITPSSASIRFGIGEVTLSTITFASVMFFRAAKDFAAKAVELDDPDKIQNLESAARGKHIETLVDSSLGAVLMAYTAVEALINEFYLEGKLTDPAQSAFKGKSPELSVALVDCWASTERTSIIAKFHLAAALAGARRPSFGKGAGQRFRKLKGLRDALIHHKPASVIGGKTGAESTDEIERLLANEFATSKICETHTFRWYKCLGAGCAEWSCTTAKEFVTEYFDGLRIGITHVFP
jgi:hypothetical protein